MAGLAPKAGAKFVFCYSRSRSSCECWPRVAPEVYCNTRGQRHNDLRAQPSLLSRCCRNLLMIRTAARKIGMLCSQTQGFKKWGKRRGLMPYGVHVSLHSRPARGEAVLETPRTCTVGAEPLIPEFTGTASTLLQEISCLLGCTTFSTVSISVRVLSKCCFAAVVDVVYLSASPLLADTWGFSALPCVLDLYGVPGIYFA